LIGTKIKTKQISKSELSWRGKPNAYLEKPQANQNYCQSESTRKCSK